MDFMVDFSFPFMNSIHLRNRTSKDTLVVVENKAQKLSTPFFSDDGAPAGVIHKENGTTTHLLSGCVLWVIFPVMIPGWRLFVCFYLFSCLFEPRAT